MLQQITLPAGNYVLAVSGGVDSVALLDMLASQAQTDKGLRLVVAHFDHGIRPDSEADRRFVQQLAADYGLPFVYDRAEFGEGASEAAARDARYTFLRTVQKRMAADAIVTAHHQDDVLETIIINWLRGTKSRGLSSLRSTDTLRRPLLAFSKSQIREYARARKLEWREDSTNADETYLRNYVRKHIMPRLSAEDKKQLLAHSERAAEVNGAIDTLTAEYLQAHTSSTNLQRPAYIALPEEVSREVLAAWLRLHTNVGITSKLIQRLDSAIRQGRNGSQVDIANHLAFKLARESVMLLRPQ